MNPPNAFVILGQPHGSNNPKDAQQIGGIINSETEARNLHMPYRLKRTDPKFQAVHLGRVVVERTDRFQVEKSEENEAPKPSANKGKR